MNFQSSFKIEQRTKDISIGKDLKKKMEIKDANKFKIK